MPSDWDLFNCSEDYERDHVVGLYAVEDRIDVRGFIDEKCADGTISNYTHREVYDLIEDELGLTRE